MAKKPANRPPLYVATEKTSFQHKDQTEKTVVMKKDNPEVAKPDPPASGSPNPKP